MKILCIKLVAFDTQIKDVCLLSIVGAGVFIYTRNEFLYVIFSDVALYNVF